MSSYSPCCRPNSAVRRIERAFERQGKFGTPGGVVITALTGDRGYIIYDSRHRVHYRTLTAAVRAAKTW